MTRCLEEEDDKLCDDEEYVPNSSTIRVKVFLPNGYPLSIILKSDATVQDAIEKTIRKSNALQQRFQRKVKELKEACGLPAAASFKHVSRRVPPWACP